MASVTLKHVSKVFDKVSVAVDDFSLEIQDKEFVVLVGPSGCGKSTTLRMIAGLEEITAGELLIGSRPMTRVEPKDRDIAMVFQNYALYPHMSVYDNIAFGLRMRKVSRREIDARVREAAEILDIANLLKRRPKALSGGQRQRVAIGRAIVRNPDVFLMDEPLSNLDAKLRSQMRAEIIRLRRRLDTTFVYVTHDQTEAMTLGDRIVVMDKGRIMQVGTPLEVFNRPANRFVAGFIGTPQMNFLPADLRYTDRHYTLRVYGLDIALPQTCEDGSYDGKAVILGVRPEDMQLVSRGGISAALGVCELMGSTLGVHLRVEDTDVQVNIPAGTSGIRPGQQDEGCTVQMAFSPEKIHLFDPDTEQRITLN